MNDYEYFINVLFLRLMLIIISEYCYLFIKYINFKRFALKKKRNSINRLKYQGLQIFKKNIIRDYFLKYSILLILNFFLLSSIILFSLTFEILMIVDSIISLCIMFSFLIQSFGFFNNIEDKIFLKDFSSKLFKDTNNKSEKISNIFKKVFRINTFFLIFNFIFIIINILLVFYFPLFFFLILTIGMVLFNFYILDIGSNLIINIGQNNVEFKETAGMVKKLIKRYHVTIIVVIITIILYNLTPIVMIIYQINLKNIPYFQNISYWIYIHVIGYLSVTIYIIIKRDILIKKLKKIVNK